MVQEPILQISDLKVKFNHHFVLDNVSFTVKRDETLAVIGPNGAGKTVLFRAMLNLIPYEGNIAWSPDVKIGYVPQRFYVARDIPLTVEEFLKTRETKNSKIIKALQDVGFSQTNICKLRLGVLSGGELQRVLIAFAILGSPNVLLFDEPTSGIDISAEVTVYNLIEKLRKEKDLTIIFISHEIDVVHKYADNVLCLSRKQICYGPPKKTLNKKSLEKMYGEEVHFHHHEYE